MMSHSVEYCPDDIATLRERLDELAQEGVRIISVLWQPQGPESDQAVAISSRGSFVIIAQKEFEEPLRAREASLSEGEALAEIAALS